MTLNEKNDLYSKANLVRLSDTEIEKLLQSGLNPTFRSLSGILQDAAEMGALALYKKLAS